MIAGRLFVREFKSFSGWVGSVTFVSWLALTGNLGQGVAVALGVLVGLIAYRCEVVLIPWTDCPSCKGKSRYRNAPFDERHSRACRWCDGAGRFLRLGAPRRDG